MACSLVPGPHRGWGLGTRLTGHAGRGGWKLVISDARNDAKVAIRFLLGTGRMPHPVGGAMGVTLPHRRENPL